jgi:lysophospholipase
MTAQLFQTSGNPIPANAFAGYLVARDGKRLRYARFAAEGRPLQGTVVIIPGRNECIEKYFETITDLSQRGFGCAIVDLRGQGGSDRLVRNPMKGHVSDFMDYAADIEPFFRQVVLPDCRGPYFVLAHSTGSLIALLAAPHLANRVERMLLLSPLLGFSGTSLSLRSIRRISSSLHAVGLGGYVMSDKGKAPAPFAGNILTGDATRYSRNLAIYHEHPELAIGGATATWVRATATAIAKVHDPEFIYRLKVPFMMIAAGMDKVVDSRATEAYARQARTGSLITIDGARHELLQERDIFREQVLAAFDAFVPGTSRALVSG